MQYRFGDYLLDTELRELRRGQVPVSLEPQVFDLLAFLLAHRDRVVTKDELIDAVWAGRIVSESALTTRVAAARRAVGDSGEAQRLIRTLARKGVRFVGEVVADEAPAPSVPGLPGGAPPLPDKPSIAVLPFSNMSDDPEQAYFADGMTEDLITALSKWRWFFVIARNSTVRYKGQPVDLKQVGQELGVRYVLEGSVRKSGARLRITSQLVEAASGSNIWAERYDSVLEDVFDLQDRITASIVGAIEPHLRAAELERTRTKRPGSLEAYDLYLRV